MNINPYILFSTSIIFALLYAIIIILGWRKTCQNRLIIQNRLGIFHIPTLLLDKSIKNAPNSAKCISLTSNKFTDSNGNPLNIDNFMPYIAIGTSSNYPGVDDGDLVLIDSTGKIAYAFTLPPLKDYR